MNPSDPGGSSGSDRAVGSADSSTVCAGGSGKSCLNHAREVPRCQHGLFARPMFVRGGFSRTCVHVRACARRVRACKSSRIWNVPYISVEPTVGIERRGKSGVKLIARY